MSTTPSTSKPSTSEIGNEVINTELSGNLFKRRGGYGKLTFNPWQLRYFTIKDGYLSYYESQESTELYEARGIFDLREEFEMTSLGSLEGSPNNFTIQLSIPNEEKWKLCAENKDEYVKWKTALNGFWGLKGGAARTPKRIDEEEYGSPVPSSVHRGSMMGSSDNYNSSAQPTPRSLNSSSNNSDSGKDISPKVSSNNLVSVRSIDLSPVVTSSSSTTDIASNAMTSRPSTSTKIKKTIKAKASAGMFTLDQQELFMVFIILNVSLIMFSQTSSSLMAGVYALIANFVVVHTMVLRAERATGAVGISGTADASGDVSPATSSGSTVVVNSNSSVTTMSSSSPISPMGTGGSEVVAGGDISELNAPSAVSGGTGTRRPVAGGTFPYFEGVSPNVPPHTWSTCDHKRFKVRDLDYITKKQKCPSAEPLYSVFAVDVFCTDNRLDNVTQHMDLPDCSDLQINNPEVPPIFCVQVQMPSDPPNMFSFNEDGPGWAIVLYFKMTQETCNQINDINNASAAVKLFVKWCENYRDPVWKARFKVIASCLNMEELGVPSFVISYNAKPVLIRKTSTIYKTSKYLETTIHVFKFANMAKQSIHMLTSRCSQMFMEIGFTIEGREKDNSDLPECLIGCASINKPSEEEVGYLFND